MAKVTVIPLFKRVALSGGGSGTSGVINLGEIDSVGRMAITYQIQGGTSTTAGTTTFSYVACATLDGTFVSPQQNGTFGTTGTGVESKIMSLLTGGTSAPLPCRYMKIIATQTGASGLGAQSLVTAELHIQ